MGVEENTSTITYLSLSLYVPHPLSLYDLYNCSVNYELQHLLQFLLYCINVYRLKRVNCSNGPSTLIKLEQWPIN